MADLTPKTIAELPNASSIGNNDLFPISQSSTSKKSTWQVIKNAIASAFFPLSVANGGTGAANANTACSNLGAVKNTGDTMTGILTVSSANPGILGRAGGKHATTPVSETTNSYGFRITDEDNTIVALYTDYWQTDGSIGAWFAGARNNTYNYVRLLVDSSNTPVVVISHPGSWRNALNLAFAVGDTISYSTSTPLFGTLLNSTTIYVSLITDRLLDNISTITINSLTGSISGANGYVDATTTATNLLSDYNVTAVKAFRNTIRISIARTNGTFSNAVVGSPVCIFANASFTLT